MKKLPYLIRSLRKIFVRRAGACPNCGETRSVTVERKYLVTSLRRCARCLLMFRTPTDSPSESARFYERDYQQGFTTHMPDDEGLKQLTGTEFRGSKKDYSYYLSVLDMLGCRAGQCVVDFGCSWGYGSHQLAHAGYDVSSIEISPSRARYAERKLGARLIPDFSAWARSKDTARTVDVFFSSHVLEHVPKPSEVVQAALHVLKPNGLFVAFHPNGSAACRATLPSWSRLWGEVHPNMIDDVFYNRVLAQCPRLFGSSPVLVTPVQRDLFMNASEPIALYMDDLQRSEMFVAARKDPDVA